MAVLVRSFAKINVGLCIGPTRDDGFHELRTVYQTVALHDVIRLQIKRGSGIEIACEDQHVPRDQSNTCWRIVERAVEVLGVRGRVSIEIEKRLPVQGGLGGASANAVSVLLALELALKKRLPLAEKLRIAAEVGSDLPLFLIGGTVLGTGRGEEVYPMADLSPAFCVIALPEISVSTPQAFKDWDLSLSGAGAPARDGWSKDFIVEQHPVELRSARTGGDARPSPGKLTSSDSSDRIEQFSRRISAWLSSASGVPVSKGRGRAETPLLDLVRTGIENDFEKVVFPKYPELREAKSVLEGIGALYASLSGSGSAVYGLFEAKKGAESAVTALGRNNIPAVITRTLTRRRYWNQLQMVG